MYIGWNHQKIFKIDDNITLCFNDFRHAFETYIVQYGAEFSLDEKLVINAIMGHDFNQKDYYFRHQIRSK